MVCEWGDYDRWEVAVQGNRAMAAVMAALGGCMHVVAGMGVCSTDADVWLCMMPGVGARAWLEVKWCKHS
jgi:hypothetical protein